MVLEVPFSDNPRNQRKACASFLGAPETKLANDTHHRAAQFAATVREST
jgi:hypothetical protein